MKKINILSLFDGISCGRIAIDRSKYDVNIYFASEIKEDAIKISEDNYDDIIRLGDVRQIDYSKLPKIDLLIGGSPCQDLSQAHSVRDGLDGNKSSLFYEYVKALKELKPKYFLLENVNMPIKDYELISKELNTYPIRINSSLVSAQLRDRFYWTNIGDYELDLFGFRTCKITKPKDRKIVLSDILENGFADREKSRCLLESDSRPLKNPQGMCHRYFNTGFTTLIFKDVEKYMMAKNTPNSITSDDIRYLTQIELERLQTLPEGYTKCLSRNKAAGCIGDGWTVDVITHILNQMEF